MIGATETSRLKGHLAQWKLIPDTTTPPTWARFAVSWSDDDVTETRKFFPTRLQADRWASWCDHPTSVVALRAE